MSDSPVHPFSASSSALGYFFQCRYALLESLRRLRKGREFTVSLETLDDVVFEAQGKPPELLQTKHHVSRQGDLTDASADLWKSIRIWSESVSKGSLPKGSTAFLVTTAAAKAGSAAHYLKIEVDARDVEKAIERLNATARTSTSTKNLPGYTAFASLSEGQKAELFQSVFVVDGAASITDLDAALREQVFYACERKFLDSLLQRLEGWWLRRSVQHLKQSDPVPILSEEILDEATRLREQFKLDSLPIDDDIIAESVSASGYGDRTFVHQLRLIEVGNPRILFAIRNYFRAFEQRSRWMREDLLLVGELDRYEDRLIEEWQVLFEQMRDELGDEVVEEAKMKAAQILYKWVETGALMPIRPGCTEPFVARGSYQILADHRRVGWHPEFVSRLRNLLEKREATA